MTTTGDLLTANAASGVLGESVRTTLRRIESGQLVPVQKLPGRTGPYLVRRGDVEALAATLARKGAAA